ncbi:MAG: hypothetical protein QXI22_07125 [Sulfolobales archaeon]
MRIIVFSGSVGSGKSTHMRLLASELRRRGVKVRVTFLKSGHVFAYILTILLAKMLTRRRDLYPIGALVAEKPHIFRRIFRLWLALDIISVSLKFLFNIYIPLKLGYTILVEEYIPATISDYLYLSRTIGLSLRPRSFTVIFLLRLMQLGGFTQIIFLDAENSELKHRWKRRGSPDERGDYINIQRTLLLQVSKELSSNGLLYVNTSKQTPEKVHQLIKEQLMGETK